MLNNKLEALPYLQQFISFVQVQFGMVVKYVRSDNGVEFLMPLYFEEKGIFHQKSCVSTFKQNENVERKHQHIMQVSCALRFHSDFPLSH